MGSRTAKIEIYRDEAGGWRWRLIARNGKIICTPGENFTSRKDARRSYRTVAATITDPPTIVDTD